MTLAQGVIVSLLGLAVTVLVNVALLSFWAGGRNRDISKNATDITNVAKMVREVKTIADAERWRMARALLEVAPDKAEKVFRIFMEEKTK